MKVEFPKEEIPPHLVEPHYKMVMDMYMHYEKMDTKQEFSYIKYAGFFLLAFLGFMLMKGKGIIGDYLIAVVWTGFGVLFASVMAMLFISSDIDWKRSLYEKEGKDLEDGYPSVINFKYFQTVSRLSISRYRAILLAHLAPFAFVGILTIWSAVTLSMRTNSNLAIIIDRRSIRKFSMIFKALAIFAVLDVSKIIHHVGHASWFGLSEPAPLPAMLTIIIAKNLLTGATVIGKIVISEVIKLIEIKKNDRHSIQYN